MQPISRRRVYSTRSFAACLVSTAGIVSAIACGSASDSTFTNGTDGGGSGNDDDGSGIGSGDSGGGLGSKDSGGTKAPVDSGLNECASDTQKAKLAPLDLVLMQDISGSMSEFVSAYNDIPPEPATKYASVKTALNTFMADPASAGIGLGISFFPIFTGGAPNQCTTNAQCPGSTGPCALKTCQGGVFDFDVCTASSQCAGGGSCVASGLCHNNSQFGCHVGTPCGTDPGTGNDLGTCDAITVSACASETSSCTTTDYSTASVPVAALPGVASTVTFALNGRVPNGDTPTSAALAGVLAAAKTYAIAHPSDIVVAVFSTDGLPTNCDETASDIEALAANALAGTPSIKTFVIGVLSPADATATATSLLNGIASSGGTTAATIIGTSSTTESDFVAALTKIRGQSLPCQFALPVPDAGTPDYSKVNVVYTNSKTSTDTVIPYVSALADCAADAGASGGWYYDVDPFTDSGTPSKVVLCPATCGTVQADPAGSVDVVQGCKTSTTGGGPPR